LNDLTISGFAAKANVSDANVKPRSGSRSRSHKPRNLAKSVKVA
jgi:hypothetical protein